MITTETLNLLQQILAGGNGANGTPDMDLNENVDPRVRLLTQYMSKQQGFTNKGDSNENDYLDFSPKVENSERKVKLDAIRRVRRKLRLLHNDLKFAQTIGDTLATALGACYLCWGEEAECENCGGMGTPGWADPDQELFQTFIAPAIQRLKKKGEREIPIAKVVTRDRVFEKKRPEESLIINKEINHEGRSES